jgi:hypothetical protein
MTIHSKSLAAALVLAFSCVLSASCLQATPEVDGTAPRASGLMPPPASEPAEPIGEAPQAMARVGFSSNEFHFFVRIKDDGEGKGGGWKFADFAVHCVAGQGMIDPPEEWDCPLEVGMPIRSSQVGVISPRHAAVITAEVLNAALPEQRASRDDWRGMGAVFCIELRDRMNMMFKGQYRGYGAQAIRWQP